MKKIIFFAGLFTLFTVAGSAQKYGHLNFGNLIASMPETASANQELETFQKQLVTKGEDMAIKLQNKYEAFLRDVQEGKLTPVQPPQQQAELQKEYQDITQYEQEVEQKVGGKRQELLSPIIDKAEASIKKIAQANGYQFVFDTSIFNAVLFAEESDDLMALVKKDLGIE